MPCQSLLLILDAVDKPSNRLLEVVSVELHRACDQRLLKVTDEFNALTLLLSQAHADEAEAQEKLEQAISTQAIRAEDMQEAQRILNLVTLPRPFFGFLMVTSSASFRLVSLRKSRISLTCLGI